MAADKLKLEVILSAIDKATEPFKRIISGSKDVSRAVKEARDSLKELEKQQAATNSYKEAKERAALISKETTAKAELFTREKNALAKLAVARRTAKTEYEVLVKQFGAGGDRVDGFGYKLYKAKQRYEELEREMNRKKSTVNNANREYKQLSQNYDANNKALEGHVSRLKKFGIEVHDLSNHETTLAQKISTTTDALKKQEAQLEKVNKTQSRLHAAQATYSKTMDIRNGIAGAGVAAGATGGAIMYGLHTQIEEAKKYQTELTKLRAIGLGEEAAHDADKYVRAMKTIGTSTTDNITLMRDAMTIFADEHHAQMVMPMLAKMKFANEAVFGAEKGHENEQAFMNMLKVMELRNGTQSAATMKEEADKIQQIISATGGRVGADQWKDFIKTGGIAAKLLRSDAFYNQMEPLVQQLQGNTAGTGLMSAYQGLYQGKTTVRAAKEMERLGLLNKNMVEYDKVGQLKRFKPGALVEGELYKASPLDWLEKVLLPKMAKKGITEPGQIYDTLATIFSNRKGADFFATMYRERNIIHKNANLSAKADGVDALYSKAQESTAGKELILHKQLADAKLKLGEILLPLYNKALELTIRLATATMQFANAHPGLTRAIVVTAAVVGGLAVAFSAVALAVAAVIGPFAMARLALSTVGIQAPAIISAFGGIATSVRLLGAAFMRAGVMMLANPIGLAIAAIVVVVAGLAALIYRYQEPIKAFFGGVWAGVKKAAGPLAGVFESMASAIGGLLNLFAPITQAISDFLTPVKFSTGELASCAEAGRMVGKTLVWAFTVMTLPLRTGIALLSVFINQVVAAGQAFTLLKSGNFSQALNVVQQAGQQNWATLNKLGDGIKFPDLSKKETPDTTSQPILRAPYATAGAPEQNSYQINITPPAASYEQEIANIVKRQLEQVERDKAAKNRSRLADRE